MLSVRLHILLLLLSGMAITFCRQGPTGNLEASYLTPMAETV